MSLKKRIAQILIGLSILVAVFIIWIIIYLVNDGRFNTGLSASENALAFLAAGLILMLFPGLLFLPGFLMLRSVKKKEMMPLPAPLNFELSFDVKLEFKETFLLRMNLTYMRPLMLIYTIITLFALINLPFIIDNPGLEGFDFITLLMPFYVLIGIPAFVYFNTRSMLNTNKFISQRIRYDFTSDEMNINGETFNMQNKWTDLYKVSETGKWFLLYTSRQAAIFIPKNRLSGNDSDLFKAFLSSLPVKKSML